MFDIGWSELVIVGVVALIVIGPKELPGVLRMAGQWIGKVRRMAADFQGQFQEAMREAEMADLKKQVDDIADSTRDFTSDFDPMRSMEDAFDDPLAEKPKAADDADDDAANAASSAEIDAPGLPPPAGTDSAAEPAHAAAEPAKPAEAPASDDAPPPKAAAGGGAA
jgi:sec-independent protein translocase protein TatB